MTDKKEAQPEAHILAARLDRSTAEHSLFRDSAKALRTQADRIASLEAEKAEEAESANEWRRLALQFDGHRMQALGHLKVMMKNPFDHCSVVSDFLSAPPLPGEAILAERIAQLSALAVPGWKLVPEEPTPKMYERVLREGAYHASDDSAIACYTESTVANVIAAPKLPQGE